MAEFGERMKGSGLQQQFVASNRLGRKSKKGFYLYDKPRNSKTIDESVYRELNILPDKEMPASEIVERCLWMMLNEAVLCLEDSTIACPRDGDIAAIFGIGFPPFCGGPFRYMDKRGLSTMVAGLQRLQKQHGDQYAPAALLLEKADNNESFYDEA